MPELLRVFLDANVLFSASYQPDHSFPRFWSEPALACLTSFYAAEEARRNCSSEEHRHRLEILLEKTHLVSDATGAILAPDLSLPAKDQPILAAAMQAGADYLITGDKAHSGPLMNRPIKTLVGQLTILTPGELLLVLVGSKGEK